MSMYLCVCVCVHLCVTQPYQGVLIDKCWPKLTWLVTNHLPNKPPKDWTPPARPQSDSPMYMEVSEEYSLNIMLLHSGKLHECDGLCHLCDQN